MAWQKGEKEDFLRGRKKKNTPLKIKNVPENTTQTTQTPQNEVKSNSPVISPLPSDGFMKAFRSGEEYYNGKKIIYENRKKNDIYTQMKKYNIPNEYLGKIKIYDLSYEEVESFKLKIIEAEKELLEIRNQNAELLWSNRLMIFEKELKKRNYGK